MKTTTEVLNLLSPVYVQAGSSALIFMNQEEFWLATSKLSPEKSGAVEAAYNALAEKIEGEIPLMDLESIYAQVASEPVVDSDATFDWKMVDEHPRRWRNTCRLVIQSMIEDQQYFNGTAWRHAPSVSFDTEALEVSLRHFYSESKFEAHLEFWLRFLSRKPTFNNYFATLKVFLDEWHDDDVSWWVLHTDAFVESVFLGGYAVENFF